MLLCDRCKKPIVGESKKLLDVCPDCYAQVMNYITLGSPNVGVTQARVIEKLGRRSSPKLFALMLILVSLITVSSYVAISTYAQYEAPFQNEQQLANSLEGNLVSEQSTVQAAATQILKYQSLNANLSASVASLNQSLIEAGRNISSLQGLVASLKTQSSSLQKAVSVLQNNLAELQNRSTTFAIWNVPVNVSAGYFLFETVPDTFDYHDNFSSSVPINVYYFNSTQYVQWFTHKTISGNYLNFSSTERQSDTFKLAEGCGGYVVIYSFTTTGTIYPNVSATYNPASKPTGSCA
ncbi:MAG TPA: hypothetical protein VED17_08240 [Nitrososphaerales archaeon]|nr:hypothetical protein [Nitrososphaerales archaeon]